MATEAEVLNDMYLQTRLRHARSATQLPASAQFDLASDPSVHDDHLEQISGAFGANPYGKADGWGVHAIFNELLSRQPEGVEVDDLTKMQNSLVNQGYAPPSALTEADGTWSPYWNSAYRRAMRDAHEATISGQHFLSSPFQRGLNMLGYIMPGNVFQALVGTARGIWDQAPKTLGNIASGENLQSAGALGGATEGAIAGATIGSVVPVIGTAVGAISGAVVGGVSGFLSDLFGHDSDEKNRKGIHGIFSNIWDSLSPWDEYRQGTQGFKNFMDDLGLIGTAASIVGGVGTGAKLATAGLSAVGEEGVGLMTNVQRLGLEEAQGASALSGQRLAGRELLRTSLAGTESGAAAYETKNIGLLSRGLARGISAMPGPGTGDFLTEWIARNGLAAQTSRPLLRTINGVFTGMSGASVGSRMFAGLGSGERTTTIEKAITDSDFTGKESLNWLGFVLQPEQFFPVKMGQLADSAETLLGQGALYSITEAIAGTAEGRKLSYAARHEKALQLLAGTTKDVTEFADDDKAKAVLTLHKLWFDAGRDLETARSLQGSASGSIGARLRALATRQKFNTNLLDHIDKVSQLPQDADVVAEMNTGAIGNALSHSLSSQENSKGPMAFYAWLTDLTARGGRGIESLTDYLHASELQDTVNSDIANGTLSLRKGITAAEGEIATEAHIGPRANPERGALEQEIKRARTEANTLRSTAVDSPNPAAQILQSRQFADKAEALQRQFDATPEFITPRHDLQVTLARTDTPTVQDVTRPGGIKDTWVNQVVHLEDLHSTLQTNPKTPGVLQDIADAEAKLSYTASELRHTNLITEPHFRMVADALKSHTDPFQFEKSPLDDITLHLEKLVDRDLLPHEVHLTDERVAQAKELGYKFVSAHDEQLNLSDIDKRIVGANMDLFTDKPGVWQSVGYWMSNFGLSPAMNTNGALFRARQANQASELGRVMAENGVGLTGSQAMGQINKWADEFNHGEGTAQMPVPLSPLISKTTREASGELRTRRHLPILDVRHIKKSDLIEALGLDSRAPLAGRSPEEVASKVYQALKDGGAMGADLDLMHPIDTMRALARDLRIEGMPGFVEFMRTASIPHAESTLTWGGRALGAAVGYEEGKRYGGAGGVTGATLGALGGGVLGRKIAEKTYGYLPEFFHRFSMGARYTFSLAFDLGRYMEQNILGLAREDRPIFFNPRRYITKHYGEKGWREALNLWDNVLGGRDMQMLDELEMRAFQSGIAGYSPRLHEAASAYILHQRGVPLGQIEERVKMLEGYGIGRRTAEKTANFFFFPLSFQKKTIQSLGDFVLQGPGRALMIHEGLRRYHESSLDNRVNEFVDRYLPVADQFKRLNNLSFGMGPGRFFLSGYNDNTTKVGKALDLLSTIFVPSGANTPIAQLFGGAGDAMFHLFIPTVATADTPVEELKNAFEHFIPAVRDITQFTQAGSDQLTAVEHGGDAFYQLGHYLDEKHATEDAYKPLAQAFGYKSVAGFMESSVGQSLKPSYDESVYQLAAKYPDGFEMSNSFTDNAAINDKVLLDIAHKRDRTEAEDEIHRIATMIENTKGMATMLGMSQTDLMGLYQPVIRAEAMKHVADDDFRAMWARFFANTYGPLVSPQVTAA